MLGEATTPPLLPETNVIVLWAGWLLFVVSMIAFFFLAAYLLKKAGWHVGYQLGRFKQ